MVSGSVQRVGFYQLPFLTAVSKGALCALLGQGKAVQREKNAGKAEVRRQEVGKGGQSRTNTDIPGSAGGPED